MMCCKSKLASAVTQRLPQQSNSKFVAYHVNLVRTVTIPVKHWNTGTLRLLAPQVDWEKPCFATTHL